MTMLFRIITALCAVIAYYILFVGLGASRGAPQEAAAAGIALAVVVAPYALFRVFAHGQIMDAQREQHEALLAALAQKSAESQDPPGEEQAA